MILLHYSKSIHVSPVGEIFMAGYTQGDFKKVNYLLIIILVLK